MSTPGSSNEFVKNLKAQAEANPLVALAIGVAVVGAASKFMQASSTARNARAWEQEVARRTVKDTMRRMP